MSYRLSLDELWDVSLLYERRTFPGPELVLPETARRYLEHAIAPRNRLASAVRLQMHGELKLKTWLPFTAEQVIRWDRGMIWKATVYRSRLPIRGFDRLLDGQGEMQWKFLGILPVSRASGPDTTRSTVGRMQAEVIWLPSVLCDPEVSWTETDTTHTQAHFALQGEPTTLELNIDQDGRVKTASLPRWGDPDGTVFHYNNFGGIFDEEKTFDGYTIPTQVRVGWHFGTDRFDSEGEFFRAVIDRATFR